MNRKLALAGNALLLGWYFLAMTGVSFGEKYLVTRSYKDEWFFMVIPMVTFLLFIFVDKIGKAIHIIWLAMWFVTQFLSHEWYTIFGTGFMGNTDSKIEYFKDAIQLVHLSGRYVPDVYHIVLHILIVIALVLTIKSKNSKKKTGETL